MFYTEASEIMYALYDFDKKEWARSNPGQARFSDLKDPYKRIKLYPDELHAMKSKEFNYPRWQLVKVIARKGEEPEIIGLAGTINPSSLHSDAQKIWQNQLKKEGSMRYQNRLTLTVNSREQKEAYKWLSENYKQGFQVGSPNNIFVFLDEGVLKEAFDTMEAMGFESVKTSLKEEKTDVSKLIKDLSTAYGDSNENQGKMVQLLKGLAFSDDPKANEFMKKLDKATTQISKEMNEKKESESITLKKNVMVPGTEKMLEAGDKIRVLKKEDKSMLVDAAGTFQDILQANGIKSTLGDKGRTFVEILIVNPGRLDKVFDRILKEFLQMGFNNVGVSWDQDIDDQAIYLTVV